MRRVMSDLTKNLMIISTRLPVSVSKQDGILEFTPSSGGLATGLASIEKSDDSIWVGWPGIASDDLTLSDKKAITDELKKYRCRPVFLTQRQVDNFYSGYSNTTLWPLFHYFPNQAEYSIEYWNIYKEVNQKFANEAIKFTIKNTKFWVHDYQLMLVPKMLRQTQENAIIGFFLHTPFPSFEIFRLLPEREELLRGLLGANLVGFHTYDYVRHFLSSVLRIVGFESTLGVIKIGSRFVQTDAFPIGIDYRKFARGPKNHGVKKILRSFDLFEDRAKVILTIDRADYSKGIPARLDAFELFLRDNPEYHGKVVFVLLAVPSRGEVEAYQELRSIIEQKVSRINGEFASVDWSPITYRYQSLPFDEVCALYALADVMLVTPHRDGMNLVAKEFVASKHNDKGVLILSETAGVATELTEAILVNPNNIPLVAKSIKTALSMPVKEQKQRMQKMQARISEYTVEKWANDFIAELYNSANEQFHNPKVLKDQHLKILLADYKKASRRLILLDYDGTLKGFVSSPDARLGRPTSQVKKLLRNLTKDKRNKVVIVSGRPRNTLISFFNNKDLGLIAEYGGWIFDAGHWIKSSVTAKKWKKDIKPILEQYASRTPGSEVEEKDFSLVWHYRRASPDLSYVRKEELKMELRDLLDQGNIDVFEGNKIIEIKPKRMHKGALVTEMIAKETWDFILAIGDDYTDEDMFNALPSRSYSINVGTGQTQARYQLHDVQDVLHLISNLI